MVMLHKEQGLRKDTTMGEEGTWKKGTKVFCLFVFRLPTVPEPSPAPSLIQCLEAQSCHCRGSQLHFFFFFFFFSPPFLHIGCV